MNELDIVELVLQGDIRNLTAVLRRLTLKGKRVDLSHIVFKKGEFPRVKGVIPPGGVVLVDVQP